MSPRTGVVARWTGGVRSGRPVICGECGEAVPADAPCPACYQLAPAPTGFLAAVVDTPAGARLIVAERDPAGGWTPIRVGSATGEAVRMVRRLETGGATVDLIGGGLW